MSQTDLNLLKEQLRVALAKAGKSRYSNTLPPRPTQSARKASSGKQAVETSTHDGTSLELHPVASQSSAGKSPRPFSAPASANSGPALRKLRTSGSVTPQHIQRNSKVRPASSPPRYRSSQTAPRDLSKEHASYRFRGLLCHALRSSSSCFLTFELMVELHQARDRKLVDDMYYMRQGQALFDQMIQGYGTFSDKWKLMLRLKAEGVDEELLVRNGQQLWVDRIAAEFPDHRPRPRPVSCLRAHGPPEPIHWHPVLEYFRTAPQHSEQLPHNERYKAELMRRIISRSNVRSVAQALLDLRDARDQRLVSNDFFREQMSLLLDHVVLAPDPMEEKLALLYVLVEPNMDPDTFRVYLDRVSADSPLSPSSPGSSADQGLPSRAGSRSGSGSGTFPAGSSGSGSSCSGGGGGGGGGESAPASASALLRTTTLSSRAASRATSLSHHAVKVRSAGPLDKSGVSNHGRDQVSGDGRPQSGSGVKMIPGAQAQVTTS